MNRIMRSGLGATAAALLLVFGASTVLANGNVNHPYSIKGGAFFPTNSGMLNQSGNGWTAVGVDYFPNFHYHPLDGDVHFGADYAWRSSAGTDFNIAAITTKIIWPISPPDRTPKIWGGAGLGVYIINARFIKGHPAIGGKFLVGADITDRIFIEANYDWVNGFTDSGGNGLRADGVTVSGGFRF